MQNIDKILISRHSDRPEHRSGHRYRNISVNLPNSIIQTLLCDQSNRTNTRFWWAESKRVLYTYRVMVGTTFLLPSNEHVNKLSNCVQPIEGVGPRSRAAVGAEQGIIKIILFLKKSKLKNIYFSTMAFRILHSNTTCLILYFISLLVYM